MSSSYEEMSRTIKILQNFYGSRYLFTLFAMGLAIYLCLNLSLSWLARYIARRSGPKLGNVHAGRSRGRSVPTGTQALVLPLRGGNPAAPPR